MVKKTQHHYFNQELSVALESISIELLHRHFLVFSWNAAFVDPAKAAFAYQIIGVEVVCGEG